MADIKIALTTTDAQDAALAWLSAKLVADADPMADASAVDASEMLTGILQRAIEDYHRQWQEAKKATVADALTAASPDQRAKIAEILQMKEL